MEFFLGRNDTCIIFLYLKSTTRTRHYLRNETLIKISFALIYTGNDSDLFSR